MCAAHCPASAAGVSRLLEPRALSMARRPCIEYVVLHELIHFLYPNHGREFYDFLTLYMPDWKGRKKVLDLEAAGRL
ncbi:MAG: M48 family metallopeptidase [Treponema sp.]|nr:M48 family metallopeptidase [Treponema sp.]